MLSGMCYLDSKDIKFGFEFRSLDDSLEFPYFTSSFGIDIEEDRGR